MKDAGNIDIPPRRRLREFGDEAYFSETATPFAVQPDFGTAVAHVIATCSLLELEFMRPAISLHGPSALLTFKTAYRSLRHKDQKKDFIKRVSNSIGKPEVSEAINNAYKYTEPLFDIRNAFAHNIWGECPAIPDALLLASPETRLGGQAALAQLMGHQPFEAEAQVLMRIASGEGGSTLSKEDAQALFALVGSKQNSNDKREAFDLVFGNPLDIKAPEAEVWTEIDFDNAARAANEARIKTLPKLQKVTQWLIGLRSEGPQQQES